MKYSPYIFALLMCFSSVMADVKDICGDENLSCLNYGALTFSQRCSICHGNRGFGEGVLPLLVKGYPSTNIVIKNKAQTTADIRKITLQGSMIEGVSDHMPPFIDQLTVSETDSVVQFIDYLRNDTEAAQKLLLGFTNQHEPTRTIGRASYQGRCALCHGVEGKGNGRLARLIKKPPPFNLTKSLMSDTEISYIISKGGAAVGRSDKMPVWDKLADVEIKSLIIYLKTLRLNTNE